MTRCLSLSQLNSTSFNSSPQILSHYNSSLKDNYQTNNTQQNESFFIPSSCSNNNNSIINIRKLTKNENTPTNSKNIKIINPSISQTTLTQKYGIIHPSYSSKSSEQTNSNVYENNNDHNNSYKLLLPPTLRQPNSTFISPQNSSHFSSKNNNMSSMSFDNKSNNNIISNITPTNTVSQIISSQRKIGIYNPKFGIPVSDSNNVPNPKTKSSIQTNLVPTSSSSSNAKKHKYIPPIPIHSVYYSNYLMNDEYRNYNPDMNGDPKNNFYTEGTKKKRVLRDEDNEESNNEKSHTTPRSTQKDSSTPTTLTPSTSTPRTNTQNADSPNVSSLHTLSQSKFYEEFKNKRINGSNSIILQPNATTDYSTFVPASYLISLSKSEIPKSTASEVTTTEEKEEKKKDDNIHQNLDEHLVNETEVTHAEVSDLNNCSPIQKDHPDNQHTNTNAAEEQSSNQLSPLQNEDLSF
jgi:hypothetical protein